MRDRPGRTRRDSAYPPPPGDSHDHPRPGPHSGDDTYDLIGDALAALAQRRGAWPGDDLTAITLLASLIDQAERFLPDLATSTRPAGGLGRARWASMRA